MDKVCRERWSNLSIQEQVTSKFGSVCNLARCTGEWASQLCPGAPQNKIVTDRQQLTKQGLPHPDDLSTQCQQRSASPPRRFGPSCIPQFVRVIDFGVLLHLPNVPNPKPYCRISRLEKQYGHSRRGRKTRLQ